MFQRDGLLPLEIFDTFAPTAASENIFENCVFECTEVAIEFSWWHDKDPNGGGTDKDVLDNEFYNCTFVGDNSAAFFAANRESAGNIWVNCIVTGFNEYDKIIAGTPASTYYVPDVSFDCCCLYNPLATDFPSLQFLGTGNISNNPGIKTGSIYILRHDSPCIDRGILVNYNLDVEGGSRPYNSYFDMGADEWGN
jgi:hypothetical protein